VADLTTDLRKRTVLTLEDMGIPVEYAQHEDAPSQHEIDLRYTDALTMADTVMTVRLIVKEIAHESGVHASFMPKPLSGVQGSGMHTPSHCFEGDRNAFATGGATTVCRRWDAVHRRRPPARAGDHSRDEPVGQLLQATRRRYEAPVNVSWAYNTGRR